ncbi:MAG: hypothetical protein V4462_04685, partial [Pseudomonadota bacterium]
MKKTINKLLAGVAFLFACNLAAPAFAADEAKPAEAAPAASAAAAPAVAPAAAPVAAPVAAP